MLIGAIAFGGAVGAVLRYLVVGWMLAALGRNFPWGTLAVNFAGSFLIGLLYIWFQSRGPHHEVFRAMVIVGMLGGFTTFSAFSLETLNLFESGQVTRATANVAVNVSLCIAAAALGIKVSKSFFV